MSEAHLACLDELQTLCTNALQTIKNGVAFDHPAFSEAFQVALDELTNLGPVLPDTPYLIPCRRKLKELQRVRDQLDEQIRSERAHLGLKLKDTARGSRGLEAYSKASLGLVSRAKRGKI